MIRGAGIGLTNAGPTPIKAKRAEEFLLGKPVNEEEMRQAAQLAVEDGQPRGGRRAIEEPLEKVWKFLSDPREGGRLRTGGHKLSSQAPAGASSGNIFSIGINRAGES
jgi:CO/xanthine dehydrogenase FAD-binding subunit